METIVGGYYNNYICTYDIIYMCCGDRVKLNYQHVICSIFQLTIFHDSNCHFAQVIIKLKFIQYYY